MPEGLKFQTPGERGMEFLRKDYVTILIPEDKESRFTGRTGSSSSSSKDYGGEGWVA